MVNRLAIERNPISGDVGEESPGRLYYSAYLTYYKPVPEVKALDRGIIVSRQYFLETPSQPSPSQGEGKGGGEQHVPYERFKQVNDQLKQLKDQIKSLTGEKEQTTQQQQTLEQRLAALEGDLTNERAEKQRLQVATSKKLPPELADRLRGDTPEELSADADRLLALLKPIDGPGVPPPAGGRPVAKFDVRGKTPAEIRKARAEGKI
jgi:predicted RNase H-like nuclease (RuvC/YqgF family)